MTRILLVPDTLAWAWGRRARSLRKYAPPGFQVDVIPQRELTPDLPDHYDGTLVFSWPDSPVSDKRCWTFVANEGLLYPWNPQAENFVERTASRIKNRHTAAKIIPRFRGVITINPRTVDVLKRLNPNTHLLRTGVDADVFRPLRSVRDRPPYRIGWCGKAYDDQAKWTPKGYHEVLRPLMERFRGDERIEWVINRRDASDALSEAEMVEWYNSIDLLLITSCQEGTPSTLLEALACGRGFIGTDVGIVRECRDLSQGAFLKFAGAVVPGWHDNQTAFRTVDHLETALRIYTGQRDLMRWSLQSRETAVMHYDWTTLAEHWLTLIAS